MRVAFLGLGIMGHSMATNVAKAGHEVTVWNRTTGKQVEGAKTASTPAEAARGAEGLEVLGIGGGCYQASAADRAGEVLGVEHAHAAQADDANADHGFHLCIIDC